MCDSLYYQFTIHTCIKMDDSMNPKSFSSIIQCYLFQLSRAPPPPQLLSFLIVLIRTFLYLLLEEIRNEFVMFWRKIHLKWITKYCNLCCFILMFCVLEIWRIYRATKIQEILPKGQWGPKKTSKKIKQIKQLSEPQAIQAGWFLADGSFNFFFD